MVALCNLCVRRQVRHKRFDIRVIAIQCIGFLTARVLHYVCARASLRSTSDGAKFGISDDFVIKSVGLG